MQPLIEELQWRGMIQDMMPGTKEQLAKEITTAYIGFDPTADSLHIGSLVPIILLVHLQKAGHKPIALVGGATGLIGDPSGKKEERKLLTEEDVNVNVEGIRKQLSRFLDFKTDEKAALLVNNNDWFKNITTIAFLRDAGKYLTVSYLLSKGFIKDRLAQDQEISFTEFNYILMQAYDFMWLYENHNCKIQMGGSDQWGNITAGTELIRKKLRGETFGFTCPLITKADGGKFGKTESGNVWLDPARTSPYQFYQFWLNASDADAEKWIKIFTFLNQPEINAVCSTSLFSSLLISPLLISPLFLSPLFLSSLFFSSFLFSSLLFSFPLFFFPLFCFPLFSYLSFPLFLLLSLGCNMYSSSVDLWSVGCILAGIVYYV